MSSADGVTLLRPALEVAWSVARAGEVAQPRVSAPRSLRPFLRFARLPDRALDILRRAVDEDDEFRSRVVAFADEDTVGRAGFLFLARPEGWADEFDQLAHAMAEAESAESEEQQERTARRRLRTVEEARRRAEDALTASTAEVSRVSDELAAERRARQDAESQLAAAAADLDRLRAESGSFRASADRARSRHAELQGAVERLEVELAAARRELEARVPAAEEEPVAIPAPEAIEPIGLAGSPPAVPLPIDVVQLGAALAEASTALSALGRALGSAAEAIGRPARGDPPLAGAEDDDPALVSTDPTGPEGPAGTGPGTAETPRAAGAGRQAAPKRTPAPLPPAVFDDTPEAAEHLVRLNGVVLLVDGYNVSKLRWPQLGIAEQRRRLVDALAELGARTGADVHVVFDGIEQVDKTLPPGPRRPVRVSFSPPDVEADDVIVGIVDDVPRHRPVVVASSDRRVQTETARLGANVISSQQLLAVLGRETPRPE